MLHIFRVIFVIISGVIGWYIEQLFTYDQTGYYGLVSGLLVALFFILIEIGFARRFIGAISVTMFGLVFGFVLSYLFLGALMLLPWAKEANPELRDWLQFAVTFLFCFISIIAIVRSKDDFKFVIPFVELAKGKKSGRPLIIDTSVIIDGRIADICETLIIDTPIILPRFVLLELQKVADSSDKLKRVRGRYGLDILQRLQKNSNLDIQISEASFSYLEGVDSKLIKLAQSLNGRLMTNDFNLNKLAQVENISVVNINELANALKPVFMPGEALEIKIIRAGEEPHQGIGYLDDGTMVVVEGGQSKIGQRINVMVTSVIQTNAGKMIFGSLKPYG
ncbi:MAG: TRAM domain-containing protein [Planctomycetota bacterium]